MGKIELNQAMDMQTIFDNWKLNAKRQDDRNFAFLRSLKMQSERTVDQAAQQLHEEAFSIIDCTQCANCCKTVSPQFIKEHIRRIAKHLGMEASEFEKQFLVDFPPFSSMAQISQIKVPVSDIFHSGKGAFKSG